MSAHTLQTIDVSAVTSYPVPPQVDLSQEFVPDFYKFLVQTLGDVAVSFDGTHDHILLGDGSTVPVRETWETHAQKCWVRKIGVAATVKVTVMAGTRI